MPKQSPSASVLGVYVTPRLIEAVLLERSNGQVRFVRRFVRQRLKEQMFSSAASLATAVPGMKSSDEADFSLIVGDGNGSGSSDLFMATEFGLGGRDRKGGHGGGAEAPRRATSFAPELREILTECRNQGFAAPELAFCVAPPDVSYVELSVPPGEGARSKPAVRLPGTGGGTVAGTSRRRLEELLAGKHTGAYDRERVAFLPLAPAGGEARFLAVVPEPGDAVLATLDMLQAQLKQAAPVASVVDSELSTYAALTHRLLPATERTVAVVRVGAEDTLLLFLKGKELRHVERLRSLTTYDAPETISSRVLLQQDELKLGALHQVLVHTEGRADRLLESFRNAHPGATVQPVQEVLIGSHVQPPREGDEALTPGSIPAIGVALRWIEQWDREEEVPLVNLLPKKLRRRKKQTGGFAWHTVAMLLALFAAAFLFTWQYLQDSDALRERRAAYAMSPVQMPVSNPAALKARVDSLRAQYAQYTHALAVLDSLLLGSDRWSRYLEKISRSTDAIPGLWLTGWQPQGNQVRISGTALSQTRIAQFARRHEGSIEQVHSFVVENEARRVEVFTFTMTAPVPLRIPYAAQYLREVASGEVDHPGLLPEPLRTALLQDGIPLPDSLAASATPEQP